MAHYLGNTPAVCRASYIDPRVFDAYQAGLIIGKPLYEAAAVDEEGELPIHQRAIEEAVLDLIDERERSARAREGACLDRLGASGAAAAGRRAAARPAARREWRALRDPAWDRPA